MSQKIQKLTHSNILLVLILLLALVRGSIYAGFLPPWGLIDEEQHVHYIQYVAENRSLPVVGDLYLSPEIVDSVFATRRWEAFHWSAPLAADPQQMGLEGHSYEGYQPPLFYIIAAFIFSLLSGTILSKVYVLRWIVVALSLLTVVICYLLVRKVFPKHTMLPYIICLILVLIPERTFAVSRVNNDGLLEVISAAFVYACTLAMLTPPSSQKSRLLGLFLGLGVLTKTSMAILAVLLPMMLLRYVDAARVNELKAKQNTHLHSHRSFTQILLRLGGDWWRRIVWIGGIAAVLIIPFVIRNLYFYGDLTGFAGFEKIMTAVGGFEAPVFTFSTLKNEVRDLFWNFWDVWWGGTLARDHLLPKVCLFILTILSGFSLVGLIRYFRDLHQKQEQPGPCWILLSYVVAIVAYGIMTLIARFRGIMPVIQGRFLLPVILPIVVLFVVGIWHNPGRKWLILVVVAVLLILDVTTLAGSLYYHYYLSAFTGTPGTQQFTVQTIPQMWAIFYPRFVHDKPASLTPFLFWLLPLYMLILFLIGVAFKSKCGYHDREIC